MTSCCRRFQAQVQTFDGRLRSRSPVMVLVRCGDVEPTKRSWTFFSLAVVKYRVKV